MKKIVTLLLLAWGIVYGQTPIETSNLTADIIYVKVLSATPATPPTGHCVVYLLAGNLHYMNDTGQDWNLGEMVNTTNITNMLAAINIVATNPITIINQYHQASQLKVSGNYLVHADDTPFFYLGDTGWELFQQLTLDQAKEYINDRSAKGFNVIQAVLLPASGFDDPSNNLPYPNQNGDDPMSDYSNVIPNDPYFAFVDHVVSYASTKNVYMALLPCWGDRVTPEYSPAYAQIFTNTSKAHNYGHYLGARYKDYPNIIWMLGGDRLPGTGLATWQALANGIKEEASDAIITYHPAGRGAGTDEAYLSAIENLVPENWLDFTGVNSGHNSIDYARNQVWDWITKVLNFDNPKPAVDFESNYEGAYRDNNPLYTRFDDYDVRLQNYRSVFAGAAGVTYGNGNIWCFYDGATTKYDMFFPNQQWETALNDPGAIQMGYLRSLIESRPQLTRYQDPNLIVSANGTGDNHLVATTDGSTFIMAYLPVGAEIEIDASSITTENVHAWWFNPRNAEVVNIGTQVKSTDMTFTPSSGEDWVLVIDAAGTYETFNSANLANNINIGITPVTQVSAGSMSAADKIKLDRMGTPFFIELTDDGENAIPVGRELLPTTRVTYNGTVIAPNQWSGVGTSSITLFLDTRKHDQLIVDN